MDSFANLLLFISQFVLLIVSVSSGEGPPVPIPNTEVKLASADNTWLEAAREDRSMLTQGEAGATVPAFCRPKTGNYKYVLIVSGLIHRELQRKQV